MATTSNTQDKILEAIDAVIEQHHHDWTTAVLRLAEAHAWLDAPAQAHGASSTGSTSTSGRATSWVTRPRTR